MAIFLPPPEGIGHVANYGSFSFKDGNMVQTHCTLGEGPFLSSTIFALCHLDVLDSDVCYPNEYYDAT